MIEANEGRLLIGMPVLNGGDFLVEAVHSLLPQLGPKVHLIISDDGSTDCSAQVISEAVSISSFVKVTKGPQKGAWANFSHVLKSAEAYDYFMWASQDDYWSSDWVHDLIRKLESDQETIAAFGMCVPVDVAGNVLMNHPALSQRHTFASRKTPALRRVGFSAEPEAFGKGNLMYSVFRRKFLQEFVEELGASSCPLWFDYTMVWVLLRRGAIQVGNARGPLIYKRSHPLNNGGGTSKPTRNLSRLARQMNTFLALVNLRPSWYRYRSEHLTSIEYVCSVIKPCKYIWWRLSGRRLSRKFEINVPIHSEIPDA